MFNNTLIIAPKIAEYKINLSLFNDIKIICPRKYANENNRTIYQLFLDKIENTKAFDITVIHTVTCGKEPAPDPMRALWAFPSLSPIS